ncbi:hypothetical protein [Numidum massiliense]|uniref:hypothetical protein n=1 Tax=Numidum massiliense TaxID=1522315 RepID=UPI0006D532AB|nr:hypothetical protein [Numidum massiliense]
MSDDSQFIRIKSLPGELLFSQKKRQRKYTLTTEAFIFQKPHTTYHVLLEDIIGLAPFELPHRAHPPHYMRTVGKTELVSKLPQEYYKLSVRYVDVINRHGMHTHENSHLILPLNKRFTHKLAEQSALTSIVR